MRIEQAAAGATLALSLCPGVLALPNGDASYFSDLKARAECQPYKIQSGDDCWKIAQTRCNGIALDNLYKYNPGLKDKCSNLKVGTYVCCTSGDMPDMDPPGNADGTCKWIQANDGDSCWSIAKERCLIEPEQLYKFNGGSDAFCSKLVKGKALCCTKGKMPDLKPKKNADGSCAWAAVGKGEGCGTVAGSNFLEIEDLHKLNVGKTWGWQGCDRLQPNQRVCVSEGTPPFPASIPGISCGPQVEGTQPQTKDTKIADLNPCPLNACCSVHGYCGTTPEFCTDTTLDKTPGTNKKNTNGCISNCGVEIVNNKNAPKSFSKIGYFESWNPYTRPCLNMDVNSISKLGAGYTHIHFAFANLTEDFVPSVSGVQDQWDKFVKLKDVKRVVAFGGWAFSNEPGTNHIIRRGVQPANRAKFAQNIIDFVKKAGIDGVDFDWEYPGATDIDGSEPGTPADGLNYRKFLETVKSGLDADKTVSFAAPASFWYLKNFPIKAMAAIADYIVYMTYDLHGQWDVGNEWAVEGCKGGNCLRSHVNRTETMYSLAMVTKAGVPANKVMVGVSSYGRSFKMAKADCKGPTCTFLGARNQSPAMAGECTKTSGYLADSEIRQTQKTYSMGFFGGEYQSTYDKESDTDIFIYDSDQWVAWMDIETKKRRTEEYKKLNFAGTSDWAVDLQQDFEYDALNNDTDQIGNVDLPKGKECVLNKNYDSLDALANDAEGKDEWCLAAKAIEILRSMLDDSFDGYDEAAAGYDGLFPTYEKYIKDTLHDRITQWLWNDDRTKAGYPYYKCFGDPGTIFSKRENAKEYQCNKLPGKNGDDWTFWFERQDKEGWEKSLSAAGIDPEWVEEKTFEDTDGIDDCPNPDVGCITTNTKIYYYPTKKDKIEIPDPKDVVVAAKKNFTNVQNEFDRVYVELGLGLFDGAPADAVDVLSIPVSMLKDAIDSMKEVKDLAKKVNDENRKNLILKILEAVLFLVPFVGGLVGGLGRVGAQVARFLTAIEVAGNGGLGIFSMVENPDMAPVAILGMVLGSLGTPSGSLYRPLGKAKRDMTPEMKANMGKNFKDINPKIEKITAKMCTKK
ncbi:killer toxin subunits alpha/beta [Lasiosphaeria hispida]|uniref:chitinase n=1 Tax=Lasiosphaeria hispida TaxID=260671 RepID=A0AAJ0MIX1_9PEZI|nr:killer toxin subunits alpha/beta [Lasiosphaeria hispida]